MGRSLEERINLSKSLRENFPDTVPVIIERASSETLLQQIDKRRFLVPETMTLNGLLNIIKLRLGLTYAYNSIWLFSSKGMLSNSLEYMSDIYNRNKEKDGFLYILYRSEDTFGHQNITF